MQGSSSGRGEQRSLGKTIWSKAGAKATRSESYKPSQRLQAASATLVQGIVSAKPMVSDDKLMFPERTVHETSNPLAVLFRMFMNTERITSEEYKSRVHAYGRTLGCTPARMATPMSNARKAIEGDNLTIAQLQRNVEYMGWTLDEVTITVRDDKTGERVTYSTTDLYKYSTSGAVKKLDFDPVFDDTSEED